jgi:hypothetical protein
VLVPVDASLVPAGASLPHPVNIAIASAAVMIVAITFCPKPFLLLIIFSSLVFSK